MGGQFSRPATAAKIPPLIGSRAPAPFSPPDTEMGRRNPMKRAWCVCLFVFVCAILLMVLVAAQSNPAAYVNQPTALSDAPKLLTPPRLKFAKAVGYDSGGGFPDSVAVGDVNG